LGHNLQVLASKKIAGQSKLAPVWFQTEFAEEFHLHIRNLRILFGTGEYETFCKGIAQSYKSWLEGGSRPCGPGNFALLHRLNELPKHSEFDTELFQIELQDPQFEGDMIHFHYRNMRLHLTKEEFEEFALVTLEALTKLYPKKYEHLRAEKQP
jgi:hypothetical protein